MLVTTWSVWRYLSQEVILYFLYAVRTLKLSVLQSRAVSHYSGVFDVQHKRCYNLDIGNCLL